MCLLLLVLADLLFLCRPLIPKASRRPQRVDVWPPTTKFKVLSPSSCRLRIAMRFPTTGCASNTCSRRWAPGARDGRIPDLPTLGEVGAHVWMQGHLEGLVVGDLPCLEAEPAVQKLKKIANVRRIEHIRPKAGGNRGCKKTPSRLRTSYSNTRAHESTRSTCK